MVSNTLTRHSRERSCQEIDQSGGERAAEKRCVPRDAPCGRASARGVSLMASAETAILPGERFGTSAEFWLNLQTVHDLEEAGQRMQRAA